MKFRSCSYRWQDAFSKYVFFIFDFPWFSFLMFLFPYDFFPCNRILLSLIRSSCSIFIPFFFPFYLLYHISRILLSLIPSSCSVLISLFLLSLLSSLSHLSRILTQRKVHYLFMYIHLVSDFLLLSFSLFTLQQSHNGDEHQRNARPLCMSQLYFHFSNFFPWIKKKNSAISLYKLLLPFAGTDFTFFHYVLNNYSAVSQIWTLTFTINNMPIFLPVSNDYSPIFFCSPLAFR